MAPKRVSWSWLIGQARGYSSVHASREEARAFALLWEGSAQLRVENRAMWMNRIRALMGKDPLYTHLNCAPESEN